jgi:hypothetical protein
MPCSSASTEPEDNLKEAKMRIPPPAAEQESLELDALNNHTRRKCAGSARLWCGWTNEDFADSMKRRGRGSGSRHPIQTAAAVFPRVGLHQSAPTHAAAVILFENVTIDPAWGRVRPRGTGASGGVDLKFRISVHRTKILGCVVQRKKLASGAGPFLVRGSHNDFPGNELT